MITECFLVLPVIVGLCALKRINRGNDRFELTKLGLITMFLCSFFGGLFMLLTDTSDFVSPNVIFAGNAGQGVAAQPGMQYKTVEKEVTVTQSGMFAPKKKIAAMSISVSGCVLSIIIMSLLIVLFDISESMMEPWIDERSAAFADAYGSAMIGWIFALCTIVFFIASTVMEALNKFKLRIVNIILTVVTLLSYVIVFVCSCITIKAIPEFGVPCVILGLIVTAALVVKLIFYVRTKQATVIEKKKTITETVLVGV